MTKDLKILPCAKCGRVGMPRVRKDQYGRGKFVLVTCHNDLCWAGPACRDRDEAIAAWNEMMRKVDP